MPFHTISHTHTRAWLPKSTQISVLQQARRAPSKKWHPRTPETQENECEVVRRHGCYSPGNIELSREAISGGRRRSHEPGAHSSAHAMDKIIINFEAQAITRSNTKSGNRMCGFPQCNRAQRRHPTRSPTPRYRTPAFDHAPYRSGCKYISGHI